EATAAESPAPGGGSISAYVGALGAALGTMVANLSAGKKGWDEKIEYYSEFAEEGQRIKDLLLKSVDEDTMAFNQILEAFKLPKGTETEVKARSEAIASATKGAILVPLNVMKVAHTAFPLLKEMVINGLQSSASDAGVGALCIRTCIEGAFLNVKINCSGFKEAAFVEEVMEQASQISQSAKELESEILDILNGIIKR
ncbi:MAG: cyclodeaminase/cyclohydrolase family protein, partial [Saprospiraceae bacterium]|nr:cyclodeaminase/cyclohydrolase family protein [Saprospiraceae bacterium]